MQAHVAVYKERRRLFEGEGMQKLPARMDISQNFERSTRIAQFTVMWKQREFVDSDLICVNINVNIVA